jgi:hypothetical protein
VVAGHCPTGPPTHPGKKVTGTFCLNGPETGTDAKRWSSQKGTCHLFPALYWGPPPTREPVALWIRGLSFDVGLARLGLSSRDCQSNKGRVAATYKGGVHG